MIPKIIHYIWFGRSELPDDAVRCMESWKKYCPDYTVMRWDESNFDIAANRYVQQAYKAEKWAFVSDYVRLWALITYGGVYMDTDVELTAPIDRFLEHRAFSGFESDSSIPTGIMACEQGFPLFVELLHDYDSRTFIRDDGSFDTTTNVVAITNACLNRGLKLNNTFQEIEGFALYPNDWFCPKSHETGIISITEQTHAIHHFRGSWLSPAEQELIACKRSLLERHPLIPSKLAGAYVRFVYGIRNRDFAPFIEMLKMAIGH